MAKPRSRIMKEVTEQEAKRKLWEIGVLRWKLKGNQKLIYDFLKDDNGKDIRTVLVSRRYGKSYTLCTIAIETCLTISNAVVKYICPKQKMVKRIINPIIKIIIEDCPDHMKPRWVPSEGVWLFPNGSEIQIAGSDNGHYDSIRGGFSHLNVVDEAGFCDDLEEIVYNVLGPTTDTTGGITLLASTPNPRDANHEFHEHFVTPGMEDGSLITFDIYTSPMLTEKQVQRIIKRYPGGVTNPKFRCEYLCMLPKITEASIIPEFNDDTEKSIIIKDTENSIKLPHYCDFYTAMDIGFKDLTISLYAYYDFTKATVVILDEHVINGVEMTTDVLADRIKEKEELNYFRSDIGLSDEPFLRIMDIDLKLQNDLQRLHDLTFMCTSKDSLEAMVNQLRIWMGSGRILIHERCVNLRHHLKNGQWTKTRSGFARLKGAVNKDKDEQDKLKESHCDGVAALMYLVRNINEYKNPFPSNYDQITGYSVHQGKGKGGSTSGMAELARSLTRFVRKDRN